MKETIDFGEINQESSEPKFLQVAQRIRELIENGTLKPEAHLPSVNQLIAHFQVSRDTIVKAYQWLKDSDYVESSPSKAYYVRMPSAAESKKLVLFLSDSTTPYKMKIFDALAEGLGENYHVDFFSHSDNFDVLKMLYEHYRGLKNCEMVAIIPSASQSREESYFKYINPGKIIFVDRDIPNSKHPAVVQDFKNAILSALNEHNELLAKYRKIVFLTDDVSNSLIEEVKETFEKIAHRNRMDFEYKKAGSTYSQIRASINPQADELYLAMEEDIISILLESLENRNLKLGKDVGLIAINEGPFYKFTSTPISVLSCDFAGMGKKLAEFIRSGRLSKETVATTLTVRSSLFRE